TCPFIFGAHLHCQGAGIRDRIRSLWSRPCGGCSGQEDRAALEVEVRFLPRRGRKSGYRSGQEDADAGHAAQGLARQPTHRSDSQDQPGGREDREGRGEEGDGSLQGRAAARPGRRAREIHSSLAHFVTLFAARAALLAATLSAAGAAAESIPITVSSTTLFAGRPEWRDGQSHTTAPIIERVGLWTGAFDATYIQDLR